MVLIRLGPTHALSMEAAVLREGGSAHRLSKEARMSQTAICMLQQVYFPAAGGVKRISRTLSAGLMSGGYTASSTISRGNGIGTRPNPTSH